VPQCAEEASNFWRYLRPDEPDPAKCVAGQDELAKRRISEALLQD